MKKGFTMIELLVAVFLFIIVISIASATFVQSLRAQKQMVALMAANDNASLSLEQIVREIRTGAGFVTTGNRLEFKNYLGETVAYALNNEVIERNNQTITSRNVVVKYLNFDLLGEDVGDNKATRVVVRLGVSAKGAAEGFITPLQTSVSSRILEP